MGVVRVVSPVSLCGGRRHAVSSSKQIKSHGSRRSRSRMAMLHSSKRAEMYHPCRAKIRVILFFRTKYKTIAIDRDDIKNPLFL